MKPSFLTTTSLTIAALATAGTVMAAPTTYDPDYARSVEQYENQRDAYSRSQADYARRQNDYEIRRREYVRAQREYDRRYGYGAYERQYGVFRYENSDRGAYRASSYDNCRSSRDNRTAGGAVLGAIAGAVIGSNVAARGNRTEGAIVGGVVGGVAGGAIGRSTARCDSTGYYYSYSDTRPYESRYAGGRYQSDYYMSRRCRVAYDQDGRYLRVCPDRSGRYRVTD